LHGVRSSGAGAVENVKAQQAEDEESAAGGSASSSSQKPSGKKELAALRSDEVENLLKYGAYDLFKEEREGTADNESRAFCEADIDQVGGGYEWGVRRV
jgi:hypothetical protein